jgi:hypothetical protein
MRNSEYNAEIEVWWAAPDKWRRTVKSLAFTQIAIQKGGSYYESNSAADYLPYWLDKLIRGSIDPIPVDALASVSDDGDRPGCGHWEIVHGSGRRNVLVVCGLLRTNFAEGATVVNSKFAPRDLKQVPRRIELFIATTPTVVVTVDSIEAL